MFPENWQVSVDESRDASHSVTLFAPGGAFWTLAIHPAGREPSALCDQVLTEMKREYDSLDSEPVGQEIAGHDASGYEMNFIHLDLTCTSVVMSFRTYRATYLVLAQAEDRDYERLQDVFKAISASLKIR